MNQTEINDLSFDIHLENVKAGWWDNPKECVYQKMQLISTEIAEATAGARQDLMDTHLPFRSMEEVETADVMIRLLDLGGKLRLDYSDGFSLMTKNCKWSNYHASVGKQHLGLNMALVSLAFAYEQGVRAETNEAYSKFIDLIQIVAKNLNYDLFGAIQEKLKYNINREDHKSKNRSAKGGKKF
jgi:hypothetical protein